MAGRTVFVLAILAVLPWWLTVGSASATVDLTGSWNFDYDVGFSQMVDIVQTGTMLTITPTGGSGETFTGTIKPDTGQFSLTAPPQPGGEIGGLVYGPSPGDTMDGTAAADGNSLAANGVSWIIKTTPPVDFQHFPWFGYPISVTGTRQGLSSCDPGELCVDLNSAQVTARRRVRMQGSLSAGIGSPTTITVTVGTTSLTDAIACTLDSRTLKDRCFNADRTIALRLRRKTATDDWTLHVTVRRFPVAGEPTAPVELSIEDDVDSAIVSGMLSNCVPHGPGLKCAP